MKQLEVQKNLITSLGTITSSAEGSQTKSVHRLMWRLLYFCLLNLTVGELGLCLYFAPRCYFVAARSL